MTSKADYVRSQPQTRGHTCHWPGCGKQVPPAMWGCKAHWFALPATLRARVWRAYRPGQENDMRPSESYMEVAQAVQDWIAAQSALTVAPGASAGPMYEIEVEKDITAPSTRCYMTRVNGHLLRDVFGYPRHFRDSSKAALAGTKYVDEVLRPQSASREEPDHE